ncbi:hypothetical protein Salat_2901900 [Sesamum alatum]|uniref:Uncharacterized protein n=1 Tax=Sesamum alatum TaxID=300844 RepID=A0AAE2C850_9LAMI|nr:hypothetical protein Salat_2901900 [Sesamum alatum]
MKSTSTSDVLPPNCSSRKPESSGKNMMRKRSSDRESGPSRTGEKIVASSPVDRHCISDSRRNSSSSGSGEEMTGDASVWTQRSMNVNTRIRPSYQRNGRNSSSVRQPSISISRIPDNVSPFNGVSQNALQQFSQSGSSSGLRSYSLSSNNDDTPSATSEPGSMNLMSHEVLHRHNMDSISEVLL